MRHRNRGRQNHTEKDIRVRAQPEERCPLHRNPEAESRESQNQFLRPQEAGQPSASDQKLQSQETGSNLISSKAPVWPEPVSSPLSASVLNCRIRMTTSVL